MEGSKEDLLTPARGTGRTDEEASLLWLAESFEFYLSNEALSYMVTQGAFSDEDVGLYRATYKRVQELWPTVLPIRVLKAGYSFDVSKKKFRKMSTGDFVSQREVSDTVCDQDKYEYFIGVARGEEFQFQNECYRVTGYGDRLVHLKKLLPSGDISLEVANVECWMRETSNEALSYMGEAQAEQEAVEAVKEGAEQQAGAAKVHEAAHAHLPTCDTKPPKKKSGKKKRSEEETSARGTQVSKRARETRATTPAAEALEAAEQESLAQAIKVTLRVAAEEAAEQESLAQAIKNSLQGVAMLDQEMKTITEHLARHNLEISSVEPDGDCQFEAIQQAVEQRKKDLVHGKDFPGKDIPATVPDMRTQVANHLNNWKAKDVTELPLVMHYDQVCRAVGSEVGTTLEQHWAKSQYTGKTGAGCKYSAFALVQQEASAAEEATVEDEAPASLPTYLECIKGKEFGDELTMAAICDLYTFGVAVVMPEEIIDALHVSNECRHVITLGFLPTARHWVATRPLGTLEVEEATAAAKAAHEQATQASKLAQKARRKANEATATQAAAEAAVKAAQDQATQAAKLAREAERKAKEATTAEAASKAAAKATQEQATQAQEKLESRQTCA
jgi:hypothetical protein